VGGRRTPREGFGRTLTVIEHATTDSTTDTGATGDTAGDILTFANEVFDRADAHAHGDDFFHGRRVSGIEPPLVAERPSDVISGQGRGRATPTGGIEHC
jgi:hypothetical protein